MTIVMPARRREADDLQALLEGRRASSRESARHLAPLVDLARALTPAERPPRPEFRAELRARLLAEVAAPSVPATAPSVCRVPDEPGPPRLSRRARVRQAVAAVTVTAVVAGAGAAAASTRSVPGDPLYGLKRGIENVQLALARGDVGHGRELLEQAGARLDEAERLAAGADARSSSTEGRIRVLLAETTTDDAAATEHLTEAYRDSGDPAPVELLDRAVAEQQQRLDDLLALLDPSLRAQVRALLSQLAAIGEQTSGVLGGRAQALGRSESTRRGGAGAPGGSADPLDAARSALAAGAGSGSTSASGRLGPVDGALGAVEGATGSARGAGPGGSGTGSSGGLGGLVGGAVGAVGRATGASSSSLPSVGSSPVPTTRASVGAPVPVPLPSSGPQLTDPVGTVTSAVPAPASSALPSVSACVPVPPLTSC